MSRIPKKEQIEGLINSNATRVAEKYYSLEDANKIKKATGSYWTSMFDVTRSEILSYVKEHYSLEELGLYDKKCYLNLKKKGKKYIIYCKSNYLI